MIWKKFDFSKKGALIGLFVWIFLFILLKLSEFFGCAGNSPDLSGIVCHNFFRDLVIIVFNILGFPIFLLGGTPTYSTYGPYATVIFYLGNLIWFSLIGFLIGKLISKKK